MDSTILFVVLALVVVGVAVFLISKKKGKPVLPKKPDKSEGGPGMPPPPETPAQ